MKLSRGLKMSFSLVVLLSLSACAGAGSGDTGTVKLQLDVLTDSEGNFTRQGAVSPHTFFRSPLSVALITPDKFEMKILAAYAVEDVDASQNNVGDIAMIWLNEACEEINNCTPSMVDYFDLTDPTAANVALNSQAREVDFGTYRYVRLEFCQGSADSNNVRITYQGTPTEKTYGGCGVTSAELSTPIELTEAGQSLTVQLSYDLSDGEVYDCGDSTPCLGSIELVPSLVTE
jgi:hypothetical protein